MRRLYFPAILAVYFVAAATALPLNARFREKLTASDGTTNDQFGYAVDVDGDWAVVGSPKPGESRPGAAYFFQWDGTNWTQRARVTPSDSVDNDYFGEAVAISGDSAIVGTTRPVFPTFTGKAYVFTRSGTTWTQQASMSHGSSFSLFGGAVDISGDYAIVGEQLGANGLGVSVGRAHIYKRSGANWGLEATLFASDGADGDSFGCTVGLDGEYAIVGARARSNHTGGAYIFKRSGAAWSEVALLNNPDNTTNDSFGRAVDISGGWAVVGTRHDTFQGAYLYRLDENGNWVLQTGLPDIYGRGDFYGQDVALHDPYALVGGGEHAILWKRRGTEWIKQVYMGGGADDWNLSGTRMAVHWRNALTGHGADDQLAENAGAAWVLPVHDRNRQSELIPTSSGLHYFGSGVAVDGDRVLVGAEGSTLAQGFGYCGVFERTGQYWLARTQLVPADAADNMYYGSATALAGDYALVGARRATNAAGNTEGAAYVFQLDSGNWVQQAKLTDPAGQNNEEFGHAVETDGSFAFVGAPGYDSGEGKAVAFERQGTNWVHAGTLPDPSWNTGGFGWDVGFDGTRAIVGSPDEAEGAVSGAGAAYIYVRSGGVWLCEGRVGATAPSAWMRFGHAVDIDDDWAVCGAPRENAPITQCGAIYLFERSGSNWLQRLRIPTPEPFTNGYFGSSVALRKPYLLACANGADARRAYLFKQDGTNWNLHTRFYPGDGDPGELFGSTCDMSADHAVVGLDVEYGRKAYLFWREAWDQEPRVRTVSFDEGSGGINLDLADLFIGSTVVVERAPCSDLPSSTNWNEVVVIRSLLPETNWPWVSPTAGCAVIRMVGYPPGPEEE